MAAPLGAAFAQSGQPRTLTLRIDNDAFNFWMLPWNRPDEEYTSGVHITYDGGARPRWSSVVRAPTATCVERVRECTTSRAEIGQDIYTPARSADDPRPSPGSRPNAGWLYVSQAARVLREQRADEWTITIGVTGPPSLARFTQRAAHDFAPEFNRPTDWSQQIGFEPGVILSYERQQRFLLAGRGPIDFDVIPSAGAHVGNVNTSIVMGVKSRAGWRLRHPWLIEDGPPEITITAGLSARAIARDLFLDGNTFRPDLRVGHRPFVGSGEVGVHVRYRALFLAYRAVNTTQAYAGGPKWHPWASMSGGFTFDR
jgi:lipid A 3-O-deacylase